MASMALLSDGGADAPVRWTSTGGGWRSMFACMGFGNLFRQAGLLPPPSVIGGGAANSSTVLSAISTTSGASWYSAQLFYSQPFYDATVMSSPDDLRSFVDLWLDSYANLTARASATIEGTNATAICQDLPDADDGNLISICEITIAYGGDWAAFIEDMLYEASLAYGDADFVTRSASAAGRIEPLKNTDLMTQTALTPTARVVNEEESEDTYVYVGPSPDLVFTTPIPASYVVASDLGFTPGEGYQGWWFGVGTTAPDLLVSNPKKADDDPGFEFADWTDFNLYPPGPDAEVTSSRTDAFGRPPPEQYFNTPPFSGETSVVQAAATSSALLGSFSGLAPSVFAQSLSLAKARIEDNPNLSRVEKVAAARALDGPVSDRLYDSELAFGFAVCSNWPNPCGEADSHFLDGIATDTTALSTTVGSYHLGGGDLTKPMKVILTNTNYEWDSTGNIQQILMHWSSAFNQDVEPGEFLWLEDYNRQPMRSPQIFAEFMDEALLNSALEPVEGTKFTTAILSGTTIENPVFSVEAGQAVEVLLVNVNTPIPTLIAGPEYIETLKVPMADMTVEIATNPELLSRVNTFLASEVGGGYVTDLEASSSQGRREPGAIGVSLGLIFLPVTLHFVSKWM